MKKERIDISKDISFKKDFIHGSRLKEDVDQPVLTLYHDESIENANDEKRFFFGKIMNFLDEAKGQRSWCDEFFSIN